MKQLLTLSLSIILLVGCRGESEEIYVEPYFDPALRKHAIEFLFYAELYGHDLDVNGLEVIIDDVEDHDYHAVDDKKIVISREFFNENKNISYEIWKAVWHKMGYKLLKRDHLDEKIGSLYQSLMTTHWTECEDWHADYYIREMFSYNGNQIQFED